LSREFSTLEPGTIESSSLRAAASANEKRHQFADERILSIVRDGEAGQRVADLCETHGISAQMYYLWKTRYGGMELADLQRMRQRALTTRSTLMAVSGAAIFLGGFLMGRALSSSGPLPTPVFPLAAAPAVEAPAAAAAPAAFTTPAVEDAARDTPSADSRGEEGPIVASGGGSENRGLTTPPETDAALASTAAGAPSTAPATTTSSNLALGPDPASPAPSPIDSKPTEPGFSVQVAAVPDTREADALLLHLTAKGYPAYVVSRAKPSGLHRVRVGPFKTRAEADAAAARLSSEDHFEPWVTR